MQPKSNLQWAPVSPTGHWSPPQSSLVLVLLFDDWQPVSQRTCVSNLVMEAGAADENAFSLGYHWIILSTERACLWIKLHYFILFSFLFLSLVKAKEDWRWIILLNLAHVQDWDKISTARLSCTPEAFIKKHRGNIFMFTMMTSTHVYETNKITRLGFHVGGGRDWEWECVRGKIREKKRLLCICGCCILSPVIEMSKLFSTLMNLCVDHSQI